MSSRLDRRLGTGDAVVIGLASMIGAGIFSAVGPAAAVAGTAIPIALVLAGAVAYLNATSSAQLAAVHPLSGGTYVYAGARLGDIWGSLAGWAFVVGKTASCAAMGLTFGAYAVPSATRVAGVAAVAALTFVNYLGVRKTALTTRALVGVVVASLGCIVVATVVGGEADLGRLLPPSSPDGVLGIMRAAGLLFFAFAGYARIATLGEEVRDPERTIPRAIPAALGLTLLIYLVVIGGALLAVPASELAQSEAPLVTAVVAGSMSWAAPVVRVGAAVGALGVLLSLLAGVARTMFAMASQADLPRSLSAVHERHRVPNRAQLLVGFLVIVTVMISDLEGALGFSSFTVLFYYALTNAAAIKLTDRERRWPRWMAAIGVIGCIALSFSLPPSSVVVGSGVLVIAAGVYGVKIRTR